MGQCNTHTHTHTYRDTEQHDRDCTNPAARNGAGSKIVRTAVNQPTPRKKETGQLPAVSESLKPWRCWYCMCRLLSGLPLCFQNPRHCVASRLFNRFRVVIMIGMGPNTIFKTFLLDFCPIYSYKYTISCSPIVRAEEKWIPFVMQTLQTKNSDALTPCEG